MLLHTNSRFTNLLDVNRRDVLRIPSRNEGFRNYKVQRGANDANKEEKYPPAKLHSFSLTCVTIRPVLIIHLEQRICDQINFDI